METPLIGPDDLIPYKGITSVALAGIRGAGALLARAGLLGMIKRAEPEVVETVVQEIGQEATKKAVQDAGATRTVSGDAQAVNRQATAADTTGGMAHSGDAADALKQSSDNLSSAGTNSIPSSGANAAENSSGRLRAGGTVELFTDASGPKIPGAVGVGPTDPTAIASDAMRMPNIPSGSQARVVANNPFIPPSAGGTSSMMNYLPEAARITQPGASSYTHLAAPLKINDLLKPACERRTAIIQRSTTRSALFQGVPGGALKNEARVMYKTMSLEGKL
ncbi:hypothetical protein [Ralstonia solanacearum]|uniref:hypothetical protein n=1 Tax=Ralstonia solanacearum TaxID=305 RepID=UPI0020323DFC|nr:hypothetical protein [Ralstonia solanacearum]